MRFTILYHYPSSAATSTEVVAVATLRSHPVVVVQVVEEMPGMDHPHIMQIMMINR